MDSKAINSKPRSTNADIFIYVLYPRTASKTTKGKWDVYEEVHVKKGLKNKLLTEAAIILDCSNMKVYKDRTNNNNDFMQVLTYLAKNHQEVRKVYEFVNRVNSLHKTIDEQSSENQEDTAVEEQTTETRED